MIRNAIRRHRVPHAYVFHGPDGVGKETFAWRLAQIFLCGRASSFEPPAGIFGDVPGSSKTDSADLSEACGRCEDCRAVRRETHPDLHVIDRFLHRQHPEPDVRKRKGLELSVDVIRHFLIERVGLTPIRGRAKVFIVREADRMNDQAQNALLKTLEEPPGTTYIILLVVSLDRLLPTTQSRCQMVRFDALPEDFVRNKIAEHHPEITHAQGAWYARMSEGSIGKALHALELQLYPVNERLRDEWSKAQPSIKTWMDTAEKLAGQFQQADPEISDTEATRRGLQTVLRLVAEWYAEGLRVRLTSVQSTSGKPPPSPTGGTASSNRAAASLSLEQAAEAVERVVRAERQLDLNANPQLCIECLVNDLAAI
jgi:DNA polymerase-3 subunit delta'